MNSSQHTHTSRLVDLNILIVDDEEILAWSISHELKQLGAYTEVAHNVRSALEAFDQYQPDLVISDIKLPDGNGLELLKSWKLKQPETPIILITAHGAIDSAITALRLGAFDYLQKPFDIPDLIAALERAAEVARLRHTLKAFESHNHNTQPLTIIGQSPKMRRLKRQIERITKTPVDNILVYGETGSGKELVARAIHHWGATPEAPYVEINCASIPENLLESELFGYEKGAFTDARHKKLGLFEIAGHGTIFLDEIGELPLKLQAKLLRALEYRQFRRLGGVKDIQFKARVVAATNRNLLAEVEKGRFRIDLYYRLAAIDIQIPPLRERLEDIEELAHFFLDQLSHELKMPRPKLSQECINYLKTHSWPGNVRELRNVLQRSLVLEQPDTLKAKHVKLITVHLNQPSDRFNNTITTEPPESTKKEQLEKPARQGASVHQDEYCDLKHHNHTQAPGFFELPDTGILFEELEKNLLQQALIKAHFNQSRAAQLLGLTRHTLRYRLEKHGLISGGTTHSEIPSK